MKSKKHQSALLLAGAAAGAAVAWLGKRQLSLVSSAHEPLVEAPEAELPLGSSADPEIDHTLSRRLMPQDETTGSSLLGDAAPESTPGEADLDDIWRADLGELEQAEGYDSIAPEDLGATWLERATQTTHEPQRSVLESGAPPIFEGAVMSEATLSSSHAADDVEEAFDDAEDLERRAVKRRHRAAQK